MSATTPARPDLKNSDRKAPDLKTPDLKTKVPAAELPSLASLLTLAVAVVVIAALYVAREVLIPITLAVLLSFVLQPLVARLRHRGLWRVPAVLTAVVLALGVIVILGGVIGVQLAALGSRASGYAETIQAKLGSVRSFTAEELSLLTARMGREAPPPPKQTSRQASAEAAPKPSRVEVVQPEATPFQILERIATPILGPLGSVGVMLVVAVFILMQMEDLRDRMIRLFGSGDLHRTTAAMDDAAARLSRYFLAQLALNAGFGLVVMLGLFLIGVPSPALFGIIAALFRFVPYVGSFAAAVLPSVLAAGVDPGWSMVLETLGLFVVIETVTGQVVEPLAYGHSTGLSPVSVVIAAIFWAWLWGPVGLILSMPLTLCLVVLGRHVEHLQFIDVLLGDKPALTPVESYYQRVLAGDVDETLDQAEVLLRDRSLSTYYEEVAFPGLRMAANDSIRGVLTPDQLHNVREAIGGMVADLANHDDSGAHVTLPTGHSAGTVLCVAGRGPLDEAACVMLQQVLAKRGLSSRVVAAGMVARGAVDTLDVDGVQAIVVSYLESSGSLASLRHLVRRLHARAPGTPVLVGLWGADAQVAEDERLHSVIGADSSFVTLKPCVDACVARAIQADAAAPVLLEA